MAIETVIIETDRIKRQIQTVIDNPKGIFLSARIWAGPIDSRVNLDDSISVSWIGTLVNINEYKNWRNEDCDGKAENGQTGILTVVKYNPEKDVTRIVQTLFLKGQSYEGETREFERGKPCSLEPRGFL